MLQLSKILHGRDEWKKKAIERGDEIREFKKNQKRHLEKIAQLKLHNREMKKTIEVKKNS
jgi:hypothetical protein